MRMKCLVGCRIPTSISRGCWSETADLSGASGRISPPVLMLVAEIVFRLKSGSLWETGMKAREIHFSNLATKANLTRWFTEQLRVARCGWSCPIFNMGRGITGREEVDRGTAGCGWHLLKRIARPRLVHIAVQKQHAEPSGVFAGFHDRRHRASSTAARRIRGLDVDFGGRVAYLSGQTASPGCAFRW